MTDVSFITREQKDGSPGYNRRYSRIVRRARLILPVVAAILLTVVMFWAGHDRYGVEPVGNEGLQEAAATNQVLSPRFDSTDEQGRPFTLTADEARQDTQNPNIVNLAKPHAAITLSESETAGAIAALGVYNQMEKMLALSGGVELSYGESYTLKTQGVLIDVGKQQAHSETPVTITGERLDLYAEAMELDNVAGLVSFRGPATVYLYPAD